MHTPIKFGGGGGASSSELTATAADILSGKTAVHKDSNDEPGEGTMSNVASIDPAKSLSLSSGVLYCRMTNGAHVTNASSGYPEVSVPQASLASAIGLTADIIKKGESILGITGTWEGYLEQDYGDQVEMYSSDGSGLINKVGRTAKGTVLKTTGSMASSYVSCYKNTSTIYGMGTRSDWNDGVDSGFIQWLEANFDTRNYNYIMTCWDTYAAGNDDNVYTVYAYPTLSYGDKSDRSPYSDSNCKWSSSTYSIPSKYQYDKSNPPNLRSKSTSKASSYKFYVLFDISNINEESTWLRMGFGCATYTTNQHKNTFRLYNAWLCKEYPTDLVNQAADEKDDEKGMGLLATFKY